ncbi:MAG: hypothetical protein SF002_15700 [Alphaproteobacteria bacterium]|nr:hypothetical protein [Alphaproteobacteria bacterium]
MPKFTIEHYMAIWPLLNPADHALLEQFLQYLVVHSVYFMAVFAPYILVVIVLATGLHLLRGSKVSILSRASDVGLLTVFAFMGAFVGFFAALFDNQSSFNAIQFFSIALSLGVFLAGLKSKRWPDADQESWIFLRRALGIFRLIQGVFLVFLFSVILGYFTGNALSKVNDKENSQYRACREFLVSDIPARIKELGSRSDSGSNQNSGSIDWSTVEKKLLIAACGGV